MNELKPWKCKSRLLPSGPCPYACEVETPFEPRACLHIFVAEEWEPGNRRAAPDALVEALEERTQEVGEMARRRGLTLSQFVRWCVYKYRRDREANTAGARARRGAPHDSAE